MVCVYTEDFTDRGDVKRVIMKLVELGLVGEEKPVYYKCGEWQSLLSDFRPVRPDRRRD